MAKRHHLIDVGMLGVTARSLADLRREFIDIYTGEPDADAHPYQACNGVQSWGNGSMWGVGDPEGRNRVRTNVAAWLGFLEQLRDANEAVGGGNLRAIISRALVGLHVVRHWSLAEIGEYAHRLCEGIAQRELDRLVLGWWTDDEGIEKPTHTVEVWRKVLAATHDAQRQAGCRFPFYWAEEIGSSPYWALTGAGWRHDIPQKLRDWVSAFAEPDFPVLHDASGVFMPFYYPWAANHWRYTTLPPWRMWTVFFESLNRAFPTASHPRLRIQPVLEMSQQRAGVAIPGHADMHKQIRVVLSQKRADGIWFLGWNQSGEPAGYARSHWTSPPHWAEAVQNEIGGQRESRYEATPRKTAFLGANPNPFSESTRIAYSLAERATVRIDIRARGGRLIRTLDEGYDGICPAGAYTRDGVADGTADAGTAPLWDGADTSGSAVRPGQYECVLVVGDRIADRMTVTKR